MQSSSALDCSGQDLAISIRVNNAIVMLPALQMKQRLRMANMEALSGILAEVWQLHVQSTIACYKPC